MTYSHRSLALSLLLPLSFAGTASASPPPADMREAAQSIVPPGKIEDEISVREGLEAQKAARQGGAIRYPSRQSHPRPPSGSPNKKGEKSEIAANSAAATPTPVQQAAADTSTEINVKNADIEAVIRIFSKKTKRNYILDEKVKGKISIFLPGKVSPEESIRVLDSVLALKGFSAVPIGDNLWKIVPAKEARQSTIPTLTSDTEGPPSAAMVTRLLQLKYVGADDVKQLISPLISADGLVNAYTGTNSLILIDVEDNIDRLKKIIDSLDVPFSDRDMTIIPVVNADAKDIAEKINQILGDPSSQQKSGDNSLDLLRSRMRQNVAAQSMEHPPGSAPPAVVNTSASAGSASNTVAGRSREPKIIADERTNSIIVIADEDMTARIRALVSQLDSKVDLSGNKFYVYRCQHAKADELAAVLSGLAGGSTGTSTTRTGGRSLSSDEGGLGMGLGSSNRSSLSGNRSGSTFGNNRSFGSNSNSSTRRDNSSSGQTSFSLGENISVTADPATNSLIISASKTDYLKLKALLEKLDIKRRQVLVEVMLLEVGVNNNTSMSAEFLTSTGGADGGVLAKSDFGSLSQLLSDPTKLSDFSVAAASSGSLKIGDAITIPTQTVLLTAAKRNANVNVLSAPNVLTTDNEEAQIVVGQNVPFLSSTSTSDVNLNNTFNQVDRQDVGITLRLTPQISSNDFVTLKIFTEVSNVIPDTANSPLGPTTTKRASETTVITKDSQMVVIGGLMSDNVTDSERGVPFLKDIPVLGFLFRGSGSTQQRTNLLIFITPRIVKDQFDARDITVSQRGDLEGAMDELGIEQRRENELHRLDIDRVAESTGDNGNEMDGEDKPAVEKNYGTITSPRASSPSAVSSGVTAGAATVSKSKSIEITVSPKLPTSSSPAAGADERAKLTTAPQLFTAETRGARYIVLKLESAPKTASELPFATAKVKDELLAPILVPADSSSTAQQFFRDGQHYRYRVGKSSIETTVRGVFANPDEARKNFADLPAEWYTLSPHELLSLGSGAWTKTAP